MNWLDGAKIEKAFKCAVVVDHDLYFDRSIDGWLNENIGAIHVKWIDHTIVYTRIDVDLKAIVYQYRFKNKEDAIAFKLRWI